MNRGFTALTSSVCEVLLASQCLIDRGCAPAARAAGGGRCSTGAIEKPVWENTVPMNPSNLKLLFEHRFILWAAVLVLTALRDDFGCSPGSLPPPEGLYSLGLGSPARDPPRVVASAPGWNRNTASCIPPFRRTWCISQTPSLLTLALAASKRVIPSRPRTKSPRNSMASIFTSIRRATGRSARTERLSPSVSRRAPSTRRAGLRTANKPPPRFPAPTWTRASAASPRISFPSTTTRKGNRRSWIPIRAGAGAAASGGFTGSGVPAPSRRHEQNTANSSAPLRAFRSIDARMLTTLASRRYRDE